MEKEEAKVPKSMVIATGQTLSNQSLKQLVRDFRVAMQPHTAISLKERKLNNLKDYVVMTGPLGVTDLLVFNQSQNGNVHLRIGKMPRGPCLHFQVHLYSLINDVRRILKRPKAINKDLALFMAPPLLVMHGFSSKMSELPMHERLLITVLQNLFPPIQPQSTKVTTIKRVLLFNRAANGVIDVRHYVIDTKMVEELRNLKKLIERKLGTRSLPKMTGHADIADLVLDPYSVGGLTSDLEVEEEEVVHIQRRKVVLKKDGPVEETTQRKRAVKLTEIGPRLLMLLVKIEESMLGLAKTVYHARVSKSEQEVKEMEQRHKAREAQRAKRRAEQQANVDAKRQKKAAKKERRKARLAQGGAALSLESELELDAVLDAGLMEEELFSE